MLDFEALNKIDLDCIIDDECSSRVWEIKELLWLAQISYNFDTQSTLRRAILSFYQYCMDRGLLVNSKPVAALSKKLQACIEAVSSDTVSSSTKLACPM